MVQLSTGEPEGRRSPVESLARVDVSPPAITVKKRAKKNGAGRTSINILFHYNLRQGGAGN